MADNITITPGAGGTVSTDERVIGSGTAHVQRVYDMGASAWAPAQVTVTNSGTAILAASDTRKRAVILNHETVPVYLAGTSGVGTADFRLDPEASLTLYTTAAIYGITAAAYTAVSDAKVHVIEETSA